MTVKNAEYYGYKVGDKFKFKEYVSDDKRNESFIGSEILELIRDDDSSCPKFKDECEMEDYEDLHLLEKIEEGKVSYTEEIIPVATENVPSTAAMILAADDLTTESSVENIQSLLGAAYAEDISVYITVDSVKVYWKHYEFVVDNKVSLGKIIECIDVLEGQLVNE